MTGHAHLLAPGRIGPIETRNRIVMPAMDQNTCDGDGLLSEATIEHYVQRAHGGVGLVILETAAVAYPQGATSRHQPSLVDDRCGPGLRDLAERVHAHGTKVLVQMCHHGKTAGIDTIEGRPLWVPSVPMPKTNPMGLIADMTMDEMMKMGGRYAGHKASHHEPTADDLAWLVDQFADAAHRVQRAGCDGVEIHAAHGYIVSTFLSPFWNNRTDEYGGSVANRTRLLQEIVRAIRARTGDNFACTVRIDGNEYVEGGITPELAAQHAAAAEQAGAHAIHVSAMGKTDSGPGFTDGPLPWQPGQYRGFAATVKAAVSVPVIAVGRLYPDEAEAALKAGEADFVSMGRQLLADPELPSRLVAGRADLVRPCINCYVCVAENFWDATPRCAVNARLGRTTPAIEKAQHVGAVVVIGGGPGGLEAARVAALRGHKVTLFEKASHLGGTARFSALTTPMNGKFVAYLEAIVTELGVTIRLGESATVAAVEALRPDLVVVATGARRSRPPVPGGDLSHVLTGDDLRGLLTGDDPAAMKKMPLATRLLVRAGRSVGVTADIDRVRKLSEHWLPLGQNITVVGGGLVGVEIAEFLAERGRTVTVLEAGEYLAPEMAHPRRWRTLSEARDHGVMFVTGAEVASITVEGVNYRVKGVDAMVTADHVVWATDVSPDRTLAETFKAAGLNVVTVGDAADVTYIEGAVRTAYDALVSYVPA
jgi:2,4-dienoyl-CoA reductase-like NADH-dependent reductase (Old Yellow Enzyme family)/NADPH-dependent 2,4-dienoyl-CoA reductase/sulfur reductase-like enzyme